MASGTETLAGRRLWITVIVPFGIGYVVTMAARSINAILAHPIEVELGLSSTELGIITATYLMAFAFTQIPLGILLDRWGARLTQAGFYLLGAIGIVVFGLSSHPVPLAIGRALVGIGTAGGLMASFKAISEWVEQDRIPFYNGMILGAGGLGALLATSPAKFLEIEIGWRAVCYVIGGAMAAAALIIFLANRDRAEAGHPTVADQVAGLAEIYRDRFFWYIAPLFAVSLGGFVAVQGLWLGPWLVKVVGFSPLTSAHYLFALAVAMTAGFLCGGVFVRIARLLRRPVTFVIAVGAAITVACQILIVAGIGVRSVLLWIVYGLFAQVVMINFALLAQHFGPERAGRAVTAANILAFLFAALSQFGFGLIADLWPTQARPAAGYQAAFTILIAIQAIALAWFVIASRHAAFARSTSA